MASQQIHHIDQENVQHAKASTRLALRKENAQPKKVLSVVNANANIQKLAPQQQLKKVKFTENIFVWFTSTD